MIRIRGLTDCPRFRAMCAASKPASRVLRNVIAFCLLPSHSEGMLACSVLMFLTCSSTSPSRWCANNDQCPWLPALEWFFGHMDDRKLVCQTCLVSVILLKDLLSIRIVAYTTIRAQMFRHGDGNRSSAGQKHCVSWWVHVISLFSNKLWTNTKSAT